MAGPPKPEVTRNRERDAWHWRLQGWTQQRIADELGITQQSVCDMLSRIEKRLAAEFREQAEEIKARQTEQLMMVYASAWEQWQRSCQDAERETVVTGRAKATEAGLIELPDQVTRTVEGQSGNPALLEKAMKALSDIRAIWGAEAPVKSEQVVEHTVKAWVDWPEEEASE